MDKYVYTEKNQLEEPHSYMYTPFSGMNFFRDYIESRRRFLEMLGGDEAGTPPVSYAGRPAGSGIDTAFLLSDLRIRLAKEGRVTETIKADLDALVKKFEVTKKIYPSYPGWTKKGTGDFTQLGLYAEFSCVLSESLALSRSLKFLNCLLKVNDLILSVPAWRQPDSKAKDLLRRGIKGEIHSVESLLREKGLGHALA